MALLRSMFHALWAWLWGWLHTALQSSSYTPSTSQVHNLMFATCGLDQAMDHCSTPDLQSAKTKLEQCYGATYSSLPLSPAISQGALTWRCSSGVVCVLGIWGRGEFTLSTSMGQAAVFISRFLSTVLMTGTSAVSMFLPDFGLHSEVLSDYS